MWGNASNEYGSISSDSSSGSSSAKETGRLRPFRKDKDKESRPLLKGLKNLFLSLFDAVMGWLSFLAWTPKFIVILEFLVVIFISAKTFEILINLFRK